MKPLPWHSLALIALALSQSAISNASANTVDSSVMTQLSNVYSGSNIASASASLVYGIGMNWDSSLGEFTYAQQSVFSPGTVTETDGNTFQGFDLNTHSYMPGNAQTTATAHSNIGISKGMATATDLPSIPFVYWQGYSGGSSTFQTGWVDAWTLTGLPNGGDIKIYGHTDAYAIGWTHLDTAIQVRTDGTRGTLNGAVMDYFNAAYTISPGTQALWGDATQKVIVDDVTHRYELDYVITMHVLPGDVVHVMGYLGGTASTVYGDSTLNAMSTSKVDRVVIPDGATINAASGALEYRDGNWIYATAVPEPSAWLLLSAGLVLIATQKKPASRG